MEAAPREEGMGMCKRRQWRRPMPGGTGVCVRHPMAFEIGRPKSSWKLTALTSPGSNPTGRPDRPRECRISGSDGGLPPREPSPLGDLPIG